MVPFEGRLMQLWMYYHNGSPDDNQYAHPLDFVPIVDLHLGKVCCPAASIGSAVRHMYHLVHEGWTAITAPKLGVLAPANTNFKTTSDNARLFWPEGWSRLLLRMVLWQENLPQAVSSERLTICSPYISLCSRCLWRQIVSSRMS